MKRYHSYIAYGLFAVAALSSCTNEEDNVFDESAAMRLQRYNADYAETLTSQGGKWSMEYFCNTEEPGYVFVMNFSPNGSVEVSGMNDALDLKFGVSDAMVSDRSAWELIADSGPVLTFNTFNKVLHEFSDPADIKDGKLSPDTGYEINETGYGHRGDYEFKVISKSDDGNSFKLKGKKTGYYIYMYRLAADTDDEAYLRSVREQPEKVFDARFPTMIMTEEATGEEFVILNAHMSYITAYPRKGDNISQSVTANGIITAEGIRFREPVTIQRADRGAAPIVVERFVLQDDGSLRSDNGFVLAGQSPADLLNDERYTWSIDFDSFEGKFKEPFKTMTDAVNEKWSGKRDLTGIKFCFRQSGGIMKPVLYYEFGSNQAILYIDYAVDNDGKFAWTVYDHSKDVDTFVKNVPSVGAFIDLLNTSSFRLSVENLTHTTSIKFEDTADPTSSFVADLL